MLQAVDRGRRLDVDDGLLDALAGLALHAGRAGVRRSRQAAPERASPAEAARRAREVILEGLAEIAPGTPAFDERAPALVGPGMPGEYFLIDPADGAQETTPSGEGSSEVTIDIALVRDGAPVLGVVYAPSLERLWRGGASSGAWLARAPEGIGVGPSAPIRVRTAPEDGIIALASRSDRAADVESFLSAYRVTEVRLSGASLRLCLVADGSADIYPQLGRSMAWSTAAGDAVLRAAGGRTVTLDGAPLTYPSPHAGGDGFANPPFVALGSMGLRTP